MKIFYLLLYFYYIGQIKCIIPSSVPDCSLESPNIEYIYTTKDDDNIYTNQKWKVMIGERHFLKKNQCITDLLSFEVWLKGKNIGDNLCGYMGIKVHDESYFIFQELSPNNLEGYNSLKIDKKYDEAIMTFGAGINFKNFIEKKGNLRKDEWLSLLHYLNTYFKNENNNNNTIYCYKKLKEKFFLQNFTINYTPVWFSRLFFNIFGYEYYIYGKPEEVLAFVEKKINYIGNELFKKNNFTLNKDIGEYIMDEDNKNETIFQVHKKIIVDSIYNGFKIKKCISVDIKHVIDKVNKCGEKFMVYTNYGIRFYDPNLQTLILPEDLESCDNTLKLKNVLTNKNAISKESMISVFRFHIKNMDILTIIIFYVLIISCPILIISIAIIKIKLSRKKRKILYNVNNEEKMVENNCLNENVVEATLV
uniref:Uncharacterized protein n=1 Tax=Strongyloides stercoralis TaxID=6248 RepID=A0AAF5D0U2_STRER